MTGDADAPLIRARGCASALAWRPRDAWDWLVLCFALIFLLVPLAPESMPVLASRLYNISIIILLYMVLALGLNIVVGWVGLLDLGYVGFVLIGVYTTVILSTWLAPIETLPSPVDGLFQTHRPGGGAYLSRGDPINATTAGVVFGGSGAIEVKSNESGRFVRYLVAHNESVRAGAPVIEVRAARSHPLVFLAIMAVAALHAMIWGLIRGVPVLRLRDDYFAIVTFAFAEIVYTVVKNEVWLTGGPAGYPSENSPNLGLFTLAKDSSALYYFIAAMVALTTIAMMRLSSSRIGRAWFAIRADETSAQTSGIAVKRYKMLGFAISAMVAGIGGSLMGFHYNVISTNTFDFWLSVIVLCCIVLGGMGSIRGVLIGTAVLMGMGELLRDVLPRVGVDERARMLFYGLVMIGIMIFRARGLHPPRIRAEAFDPSQAAALARAPGRLQATSAESAP